MRKIEFKKILREYWIFFFVVAILVCYYIILPIVLCTTVPIGYVVSCSMEPTYKVGDLVIIRGVSPKDVHVGDVIVFRYDGKLIMHRVIKIKFEDGVYWFLTRGDNPHNAPVDYWLWVREDKIIGVVIARVPLLGYIFMIISNPAIRIFLILILVNLIIVDILLKQKITVKPRKKSVSYNWRRTIIVLVGIVIFVSISLLVLRTVFMQGNVTIDVETAGKVIYIENVGFVYPLYLKIESPTWPARYVSEVRIKFVTINSSEYVWKSVFPYGGVYKVGATIISKFLEEHIKCIIIAKIIDPLTGECMMKSLESDLLFQVS